MLKKPTNERKLLMENIRIEMEMKINIKMIAYEFEFFFFSTITCSKFFGRLDKWFPTFKHEFY